MVDIKKNTILKIAIFTSLLFLLLISSLIFFKENDIPIKEENILFRLYEIQHPDQVLWYKNELFVKKDEDIKKLNIEKRILENFKPIKSNQILGIYEDNLVLVEYENHIITTPQEDATDIVIFNFEGDEIFSKSFHETIKPLYIENNFLFLIDNYLNSPERTYRVNLENEKIELFEIEEQLILQGDETIEILDKESNLLFNIPKVNDITSFSVNENLDKIALIDIQGNVWIFLKNPNDYKSKNYPKT